MKRILCFGDSNTYGLSPEWVVGRPGRYDERTRWPCVLQRLLGEDFRIIEEGLSGRTTVFDDPTATGRRGLDFIGVCIESHQPLDLVILMLGTNDTKSLFGAPPFLIAEGMRRLAEAALNPYGSFMFPAPRVLIAAPVPLGSAALSLPDGITDSAALEKSRLLAGFYKQTAGRLGCDFIDLAEFAEVSPLDGIHLPPEGHLSIAEAFAEKIKEIFPTPD